MLVFKQLFTFLECGVPLTKHLQILDLYFLKLTFLVWNCYAPVGVSSSHATRNYYPDLYLRNVSHKDTRQNGLDCAASYVFMLNVVERFILCNEINFGRFSIPREGAATRTYLGFGVVYRWRNVLGQHGDEAVEVSEKPLVSML
jgi:hypothetical protein